MKIKCIVLGWSINYQDDRNFKDTLEPWLRKNRSSYSFALVVKRMFILDRWSLSNVKSAGTEISPGIWLLDAHSVSEKIFDQIIGGFQHNGFEMWLLINNWEICESLKSLYAIRSRSGKLVDLDQEAAFLLASSRSLAVFTAGDECNDAFIYESATAD